MGRSCHGMPFGLNQHTHPKGPMEVQKKCRFTRHYYGSSGKVSLTPKFPTLTQYGFLTWRRQLYHLSNGGRFGSTLIVRISTSCDLSTVLISTVRIVFHCSGVMLRGSSGISSILYGDSGRYSLSIRKGTFSSSLAGSVPKVLMCLPDNLPAKSHLSYDEGSGSVC